MSLTVEATYENGVLRPAEPLPLREHEKVRVTVQPLPVPTPPPPTDEAEALVRRSYGLLRWTRDRETLRHLAEDTEFDLQESA